MLADTAIMVISFVQYQSKQSLLDKVLYMFQSTL